MEPNEGGNRPLTRMPSIFRDEDGGDIFVEFPDGILHVTPQHPDFETWASRVGVEFVSPGKLISPGEDFSDQG